MGIAVICLCVVIAVTIATLRPLAPSVVTRSLAPSLAGSYVAAVIVSQFSWSELFPLAFPFFMLFGPMWGSSFLPFLADPINTAFLALAVAALIVRVLVSVGRFGAIATFFAALMLNCLFVGVFLNAATTKAQHDISAAAAALNPVCLQQQTFLQSLKYLRDSFHPHAIVRVADGSQYYWSYSTQIFFKGNSSLDPNFPCTDNRAR